LYALDDTHLEAIAWLSARNSILTALFCVLGLSAFDAAARGSHKVKATLLLAVFVTLAHLSSEGAVAVWAYILSRLIFEGRDLGRSSKAALALAAAVTAAFSILTHIAQYRVVGSGAYIDARVRPAEFASVVPERLLELMREQFGAPRWLSDWVRGTAFEIPLQVATIVALAALAVFAGARWRHDSRLWAVALGMLGSALVVCGARPEPRLLLLVGVGASALLAAALVTCWRSLNTEHASVHRVALLVAGGIAAILHLVAPTLASATVPEWYRSRNRAYVDAAASMQIGLEDPTRSVVILQAPSYFDALSTCMYRLAQRPISWRSVHIVGISQRRVTLRRADYQTLVLEPEHGYLLERTSQQARSPDEPFVAGEAIALDEFTLVVDAITSTGRPQRLRLELGADYEARLRFLTWNPSHQTFERVVLPSVGESIEL
jgi:hypothetical protein